jgi:hypothetical protein
MVKLKIIPILLLLLFVGGGASHHKTTGNVISIDSVLTTTTFNQIILPDSAYINPYFDSAGSVYIDNNGVIYRHNGLSWVLISGISQQTLDDTASSIRSSSSELDTSGDHIWTGSNTFTSGLTITNGVLSIGDDRGTPGSIILTDGINGTITEQAPLGTVISYTVTPPFQLVPGVRQNDGDGVEYWGQLNLVTGVFGILPAANGGADSSVYATRYYTNSTISQYLLLSDTSSLSRRIDLKLNASDSSIYVTRTYAASTYQPRLGYTPVRVLSVSGTPSSDLTGTTNETNLYSVFVPAGVVNSTTSLEIKVAWEKTGTAGTILSQVKLSTTSGTTGTVISNATILGAATQSITTNLTVWASSSSSELSYVGANYLSVAVLLGTANVDFTNGGWINFTGTLGSGSDHFRIKGVTVKIESQN